MEATDLVGVGDHAALDFINSTAEMATARDRRPTTNGDHIAGFFGDTHDS